MERPQTSTRDHAQLRSGVERWLATRVEDPVIDTWEVPPTNGMSSETILFDATWNGGGEHCVLRLPPEPTAAPVFPTYDMAKQFRVMELVAARSNVPLPGLLWLEEDPTHLGAPFFVMRRVDGQVPPDLMPYVFDSWVTKATPDELLHLQQRTVEVLAELHGIELDDDDLSLLDTGCAGETPLRQHLQSQRDYLAWTCADGMSSALLARAMTWLEEHWPAEEGPTVLSWGDARIGNILYDGFEPVAVLDWEMVACGPAGIDLGWMAYLHRFFQDIAERSGVPGLPDFMRPRELAAAYGELTGLQLTDDELRFYLTYAATRHGIVMFRIARRHLLFGEQELPADPDDLINHRATLEAMLDGTYWARVDL